MVQLHPDLDAYKNQLVKCLKLPQTITVEDMQITGYTKELLMRFEKVIRTQFQSILDDSSRESFLNVMFSWFRISPDYDEDYFNKELKRHEGLPGAINQDQKKLLLQRALKGLFDQFRSAQTGAHAGKKLMKIEWLGSNKDLATLFVELEQKGWIAPLQDRLKTKIVETIFECFEIPSKPGTQKPFDSFFQNFKCEKAVYSVRMRSKDEYDQLTSTFKKKNFEGIKANSKSLK